MELFIFRSLVLLLSILAVFGWCYNIYKLFQLDSMSGELALRAIGIIIPPLGVIMGYV